MLLVEDVSMLLMMLGNCCRSVFHCCVVWVSRFPLTLPLSDCVSVAADVVFMLHLEGGRHGDKDIDGGRVNIVVVDKVLLKSETNKQTRGRL